MFTLKIYALIVSVLLFVSDVRSQTDDANDLIGEWVIDLTPGNTTDDNFARMKIAKIKGHQFFGEFYRDGVRIQHGIINTNNGIYGALISADNSGKYNSSFYLKGDVLYGTTHAVERDFLSVWTAVKQ